MDKSRVALTMTKPKKSAFIQLRAPILVDYSVFTIKFMPHKSAYMPNLSLIK